MYNINILDLYNLKHGYRIAILSLIGCFILLLSVPAFSEDKLTDQEIMKLFETTCDWSSKNAEAKKSAQERLVKEGPEVVRVLVDELGTKDVTKRVTLYEIVNAIGPGCGQYLATGLNRANSDTRYRCADLIGETKAKDQKQDLTNLLTKETVPDVISFAIKSLGQIGDASDTALISGFAYHKAENVRRNVASALGKIKDPLSADVLLAMLNDQLFSVRYPAVDALIKIGEPALEKTRNFTIVQSNTRTIGLGMEIIAALGNKQDIDRIMRYLTEQNTQFKRFAAIALTRLEDPAYLPALREHYNQATDPLVRFELKKIIEKLENPPVKSEK